MKSYSGGESKVEKLWHAKGNIWSIYKDGQILLKELLPQRFQVTEPVNRPTRLQRDGD
ncbi:MAG: hypothetical protein IH623_01150 [Verrucomicrobia bacterium]|nr:hypothetical protein [Verrucomicrobiota bacterium]